VERKRDGALPAASSWARTRKACSERTATTWATTTAVTAAMTANASESHQRMPIPGRIVTMMPIGPRFNRQFSVNIEAPVSWV
jgi:hypothetical protein